MWCNIFQPTECSSKASRKAMSIVLRREMGTTCPGGQDRRKEGTTIGDFRPHFSFTSCFLKVLVTQMISLYLIHKPIFPLSQRCRIIAVACLQSQQPKMRSVFPDWSWAVPRCPWCPGWAECRCQLHLPQSDAKEIPMKLRVVSPIYLLNPASRARGGPNNRKSLHLKGKLS